MRQKNSTLGKKMKLLILKNQEKRTGILGAFPALRTGNRAYRSKSSTHRLGGGSAVFPLQSLARSLNKKPCGFLLFSAAAAAAPFWLK
jgi:hypothetical protein